MKRYFTLIMLIISVLLGTVSCASGEPKDSEKDPSQETPSDPLDNQGTSICEHAYEAEDVFHKRCGKCGLIVEEVPTSLKILAIGNSFSEDATQYLWNILQNAGISEVVVGNMYIGGCSLDMHYTNATEDSVAYVYMKNTAGVWTNTPNAKLSDALAEEEWDIITLQQVSGVSGIPSSYGNLEPMIEYVRDNMPKHCKLYWHMTWAYQQDSSHGDFARYGNDQMTMYQAILDTTEDTVLENTYIEGVLPSGTAVQNLRTSYFGDTLTRDGFHLDLGVGRYLAAMTWYAALGGNVDTVTWAPSIEATLALPAIREAVSAAVKSPFEVTESTHTETITLEDLEIEDILELYGYDPADYTEIDTDETLKSYYNSVDNLSTLVTTGGTAPYWIGTAIFERNELPVGSILILENGYKYRPEGWTDLSVSNSGGQRPSATQETVVVVTEEWWGTWEYRAFNISPLSGRAVTEDDLNKLHILIPKE